MTDPFEQAIEYLRQVPTGRATVSMKQAQEDRNLNRGFRPVHQSVQAWAELHGFTFASNHSMPALATEFYFRKKP